MPPTVTNLNKLVGLNIRFYRERLQLSQESFAELSGLHRTYIGAIERGERNITLGTLAKLAAALRVPVLKLLAAPTGKRKV